MKWRPKHAHISPIVPSGPFRGGTGCPGGRAAPPRRPCAGPGGSQRGHHTSPYRPGDHARPPSAPIEYVWAHPPPPWSGGTAARAVAGLYWGVGWRTATVRGKGHIATVLVRPHATVDAIGAREGLSVGTRGGSRLVHTYIGLVRGLIGRFRMFRGRTGLRTVNVRLHRQYNASHMAQEWVSVGTPVIYPRTGL